MTKEAMIRSLARRQYLMKAAAQETPPIPGQPPYPMPAQPPATSQPSFATRMGDFARKGLRSVGNVVLGPGAFRGAGAVGRRAAGAVRDARHALGRADDQYNAWPYNFSRPPRAPAPYLR